MLGLERGKVSVLEHDPQWDTEAKRVIRQLSGLLDQCATEIQHVGSTSIPHICAKPIIDIAVAVESFENLRALSAVMAANGYAYVGEDIPGQHLFLCGDGNIRTHHIHFVRHDSAAWHNYINFRDYLIMFPEKALQYDYLKRELSGKYSDDRFAYTAGKEQLISELLDEAQKWRNMSENT